MRPSTPRVSQGACDTRKDCNIDIATARCEPDIAPDESLRMHFSGPLCRCNERDHRCHLNWFDPVACKTEDDCWVEEAPVPHAIRRPARLKGRKFRGCVDGEEEPVCIKGRCSLDGLMC